MRDNPKDLLIEQAVSAHRERNIWGRILASPAWLDLAPGERDAVCDQQLESRIVEQHLDRRGWTTTVRAVLDRIQGHGGSGAAGQGS